MGFAAFAALAVAAMMFSWRTKTRWEWKVERGLRGLANVLAFWRLNVVVTYTMSIFSLYNILRSYTDGIQMVW